MPKLKNKGYKPVTQATIVGWLPVVLSDMRTTKMDITEANVKYLLYHRVITNLYDKENFFHDEDDPQGLGVHCYIKGYVRSVWAYLGDAYDLIHQNNWLPPEEQHERHTTKNG